MTIEQRDSLLERHPKFRAQRVERGKPPLGNAIDEPPIVAPEPRAEKRGSYEGGSLGDQRRVVDGEQGAWL